MDTKEMKRQICEQVEQFNDNQVKEVYGLLLNYLNSKNDTRDWNQLTKGQQQGILKGIDELQKGEGIPHKNVMEGARNKYN